MYKLVIGISALFLFGCASNTNKANLYWGDYSNSLYEVKKNPGVKSTKKHKQELISIVEKAKARRLRVPPGVYAELGMYSRDEGEQSKAQEYFLLEMATYPESSEFMKRLAQN